MPELPFFAWIVIVAIVVYGVGEGVAKAIRAARKAPAGTATSSDLTKERSAREAQLVKERDEREEQIAQLRGRVEELEYRLVTVERALSEVPE